MTSLILRHASGALCAGSLCAALALGCAEELPRPILLKVSPQRIYADRPQRLTLSGHELLPRYHFELSHGRRQADWSLFTGMVGDERGWALLRDFAELGPDSLTAVLDPGLPPGTRYGVQITDPRGAGAHLPYVIESLGPDLQAPRITLLSPDPGDLMAPGTSVVGHLLAEDEALAKLGWRATGPRGLVAEGPCPPGEVFPQITEDMGEGPSLTRVVCDFHFVVPLELGAGAALELEVTASDDSPTANRAAITRSFVLRARPAVTRVDPPRGGIDGGTDVMIKGTNLPPGTTVMFGDRPLTPGGGTRLDERTIIGLAPPGPPGPVPVRLLTPLGEITHAQLFEYLPPPQLLALDPPMGPTAGGGPVRVLGRNFTPQTRVLLGPTLATAAPLVAAKFIDPTEIRGVLPAGEGQAAAFAIDAEAGIGQLPAAFAWKSDP